MNADAFRYFYNYHFAENRKLWDQYIPLLSQEQFTQGVGYSHGSVRNQIVHIMSADDTWFCELRGIDIPDALNPADFDDRQVLRARWDGIEQNMRAYLANYGTDHRAQIFRLLSDLGVKANYQDYIFYVYDHP